MHNLLVLAVPTFIALTTALPLPPFHNLIPRQATDGYLTSGRFSDPHSPSSHLHPPLDSVTLPSYLSNFAPNSDHPDRLPRTPAPFPAAPVLVHDTGALTPASASHPSSANAKPSTPQAQTLRQGGVAGVTGAGSTAAKGTTGGTTAGTGAAAGTRGGIGGAGGLGRGNVVVSAASGAEVPGRSGPGGHGVGKGNVVGNGQS